MSLGDYQGNLIQDYNSFNVDICNVDISEDDSALIETFDRLNNLFKDYSAPDFEPSKSNEFIDTYSQFTWILL